MLYLPYPIAIQFEHLQFLQPFQSFNLHDVVLVEVEVEEDRHSAHLSDVGYLLLLQIYQCYMGKVDLLSWLLLNTYSLQQQLLCYLLRWELLIMELLSRRLLLFGFLLFLLRFVYNYCFIFVRYLLLLDVF